MNFEIIDRPDKPDEVDNDWSHCCDWCGTPLDRDDTLLVATGNVFLEMHCSCTAAFKEDLEETFSSYVREKFGVKQK